MAAAALSTRSKRLLVLGDPTLGPAVAADLDVRFGPCEFHAGLADALAKLDGTTRGFLVVVGPGESSGADACDLLAALARDARARTLHRIALVPAGVPATRARRLYEAAATEVLVWPGEGQCLPRLLEDLLSVPPGRVPTNEDRALHRVVRAHLALLHRVGESLRASVRAGIVLLLGHMSSAERKKRVIARLKNIPGVRHVLSRRLFVKHE